ncbi:MAG: SUMF1/EgtB/PvdO family nonheme iron enzyme, partial [Saprospiraceae bacterium]
RERERAEKEARLRMEAEAQREIAERAKRRATWLAWGAGALAVAGVFLAVLAWNKSQAVNREKVKAEKSAQEARAARDNAEAQRLIADSSAVVAQEKTVLAEQKTQEAEASLSKAQKEEKRALSALEQVQKEKAATEEQRRKAEENLRIAQEAESRALSALQQVQKEKAATEEQRQKAEENYRIAQAKTQEAEENAAKASKALTETQRALGEVVRLSLRDAEGLIYRMEYAGAVEKIYSLVPLGVSKDSLASALLEPVFWYGETGDLPHAWGILDTAYRLAGRRLMAQGPKDLAGLRTALRDLDGQRDAFLQARYFPEMVEIKGGEFTMGSERYDDEKSPHRVVVSDFQMGATEVTWWQYGLYAVVEQGNGVEMPEAPGWGIGGDNPVVNVSWYDAVRYANWLSKRKGLVGAYRGLEENNVEWPDPRGPGYRLPTEAEWEYAARGGKQQEWAGTDSEDTLEDYAWYGANSGSRTRPVRGKKANAFGLYGMSGNVWEWCWDWYGDYQEEPKDNPVGPSGGTDRVLRGGSWSFNAEHCRSAIRNYDTPDFRYDSIGFRLVFVP